MQEQDSYQKVKQIVSESIGRLPDDQRMVIALRYDEGLTFAEIALVLRQKEPEVRRTYICAVTTCLDLKHRGRLITP